MGLSALFCVDVRGVVTFDFTYSDDVLGNDNFVPVVEAIEDSFSTVGTWFNHTATVDVFATPDFTLPSNILARGTAFFSSAPGVHDVRMATHIFTGTDPSAGNPDGELNINPFQPFDYDDEVDSMSLDFKSVMMHEALHMLGFLGALDSNDNLGMPESYLKFDSFLSDGTHLFITESGEFDVVNADPVDLVSGSVFFTGSNAVAAYGGLVPIDGGLAHLDGDVFGTLLMTPTVLLGPAARFLDPVEVGILEDLGFSINASALAPVPEPAHFASALGLAALLMASRRRRSRRTV